MRREDQCQNCACFYANWDEEVALDMLVNAAGEECSNGQSPDINEKCRHWQGADEGDSMFSEEVNVYRDTEGVLRNAKTCRRIK